MIDRRALIAGSIAGSLAAGFAPRAAAQTAPPRADRVLAAPDPTETIDLWPGLPPGAPATLPLEETTERSTAPAYNDRFVRGIARPRMAVFRPERPNGGAVLITPGGGYRWVVIDKEGYELARLLTAQGYTAFVLFYRLPHEGWADRADVPLQDAQRAMRLIRHRARDFGIAPDRIAATGFSAGGHLCADLMTRFAAPVYAPRDAADRESARPDAAAPIYPVIAMEGAAVHQGSREHLLGDAPTPSTVAAHTPSNNVGAQTPPAFLLHAENDAAVPVENTLMLRAALRAAAIPAETHLYPDGGHGFGLRLSRGASAEGWPRPYLDWLARVIPAA